MKRDLHSMSQKTYDLLIVGGGITGASIAWDAALRGLSVALVEKNDFSSATSSAPSKLIHGGLRYLQNFELGLVRESLRERRLWSQNAPHMVYPLMFMVPTSGIGVRGRAALKVGLTLYDLLAFDRNRLDDPDQHIPAHTSLTREQAIAMEPGLAAMKITGAMTFHDCQVYSPERLNLECVLGAAAMDGPGGADVANYAEVVDFLRDSPEGDGGGARDVQKITGVRVRDRAGGGTEYTLRGRLTINAAGPWADRMMGAITGGRPPRALIRSKGIHLITRNLTNGHCVAATAPGGGHFFILPWRGHSLIGTTDTVYNGDPDDFGVTEKDIVAFLELVNQGYPAAKLVRSDVQHFYGGMRPLVDKETKVDVGQVDGNGSTEGDEKDPYTASRAAEIVDHEAEGGIAGVVSAMGGKWTTSRHLAEKVVDLAIAKIGAKAGPCVTQSTPTYGGDVGRFRDFEAAAVDKRDELSEAAAKNLARNYGSRMEDVFAYVKEDETLAEPICEKFPIVGAQVLHSMRDEMAMTLDDVVFRRTGLGTLGHPGDVALKIVADMMAAELGWDEAERRSQIERTVRKFSPLEGTE